MYHGLLEYYVMKVCHGKTPLVCDSGSSGSYAGLLRPYTDAHGNARTHGHTAANCNSGPHVDTHTDGDAHPHQTPRPTPTEAPSMTSSSGGIAPLRMDDPLAIANELSPEELACIAGVDDVGNLIQLLTAPEMATPEQQSQLLGCMEDETVLRLFLTGFISETGPLSVESSECIRGGMEGIDLRSIMMAGNAGDEQTAMVGSMSAMFVTISCLNDEDFEVLAPVLGMDPGERRPKCVSSKPSEAQRP